ncbi:MAG: leucine-rich repeat domain-containing protein, partial [Clostridia bacterium]|nr:leucine-rich repeat domain-containing protein [Clostridia bacterium]
TPLDGVTNVWVLDHTYEVVEYVPGKEPTCTEWGKAYHKCDCAENVYQKDSSGTLKEYDVEPLGHTEVVDEAVAPTCTATGLTEGSHCSDCGAVIVAQETIAVDSTAHNWGEYTYDHETHTKVCLHNPSHVETAEHTIITDKTGDEASLNGSCSVCGHQEYVIAGYSKNGYSGYKLLKAGKDFEGGDVVIPTEINNKPVLLYGNSSSGYQMFTAEQNASITSVYVPETLLRIGYQSFTGCNNLTEVTFAENSILDKIYAAAFKDCTSLTKIELPDSLDTIDYDAFRGCTSLSDVTLGNGLTTICSSVFYQTAIETIYIPASVTTIGNAAFRACSNLTTVVFDENCSLTQISAELFYDCAKLSSINIPETVTTIQVRAFRGCSVLTGVTIPESVVTIGPEAFWQCD